MSSPVPIPARSSPALYVPVHRRSPGSYPSSSATPSPPPPRSRPLFPPPTLPPVPGVYTPAELIVLSTSPLVVTLPAEDIGALRARIPEVVQTRKKRKALAWHARHPSGTSAPPQQASHGSESEEDRATTWRRV